MKKSNSVLFRPHRAPRLFARSATDETQKNKNRKKEENSRGQESGEREKKYEKLKRHTTSSTLAIMTWKQMENERKYLEYVTNKFFDDNDDWNNDTPQKWKLKNFSFYPFFTTLLTMRRDSRHHVKRKKEKGNCDAESSRGRRR